MGIEDTLLELGADPEYYLAKKPEVLTQTQIEHLEEESNQEGYDVLQVQERCRHDMNFLAALAIPEVFVSLFPPLFTALWQLLIDKAKLPKDFSKLALGLPRGFAKTTFLKLFCLWLILFTDKRFILVICNSESLAVNFVSDVMDMLEELNIQKVFGDYRIGIEKDNERFKKFAFRGRNITIAALGAGSSLRGLNLKFRRPDIMIMDDMQKKEEAESELLATKLYTWMLGTLMKAKAPEGCLYIFVGNMYPYRGAILKKLKHNTQWVSFIVGGLLADGESIWPELQSRDALLDELRNDLESGHPEIFFAEVLNDEEAGTRSGINVGKIPPFPDQLQDYMAQGGFIVVDPASGKKRGDDIAISCFLLYDGVPVFRESKTGKFSPLETINHALSLCFKYKLRAIGVESNAYQFTLLFWFSQVCLQRGITGIELCELHTYAYSKNSRIKAVLPKLLRSEILLHPEVRSSVVFQIIHWNPLSIDNADDILDTLTFIEEMLQSYSQFCVDMNWIDQESQNVRSLSEDEMSLAF
jgi:hypothetical protein